MVCAFVPAVPVQEGYLTLSLLTPSTREHGLPVPAGQAGCPPQLWSGSWGVHGTGMPAGVCPQAEPQLWRMSSPFPCSGASFSAKWPALISSH